MNTFPVLRTAGTRTDCRPGTQSVPRHRRLRPMHVLCRLALTNLFPGQNGSPAANDVGQSWSSYLHDDVVSSAQFPLHEGAVFGFYKT